MRSQLGFAMPSDDLKNSVKDKAAKEEGWVLPLISCAQDTVGL